MFSDYLKSIEGVGIYPLISLMVFFIFFVVLLIWMSRADKKYLKSMSELPLSGNDSVNNNQLGDLNEIKNNRR